MKQLFNWGSHLAAIAGLLGCLFAGIASLGGGDQLFGYDVKTIFLVGIGGLVFACLLRLYYMSE